jgi:hypothetical protein
MGAKRCTYTAYSDFMKALEPRVLCVEENALAHEEEARRHAIHGL